MTTGKSTVASAWPPFLETPKPSPTSDSAPSPRTSPSTLRNSPAKSASGSHLFLRCKSQTKRLDRRASEDFMRLKALARKWPLAEIEKRTNEAKYEPKNEPIAALNPKKTRRIHS